MKEIFPSMSMNQTPNKISFSWLQLWSWEMAIKRKEFERLSSILFTNNLLALWENRVIKILYIQFLLKTFYHLLKQKVPLKSSKLRNFSKKQNNRGWKENRIGMMSRLKNNKHWMSQRQHHLCQINTKWIIKFFLQKKIISKEVSNWLLNWTK